MPCGVAQHLLSDVQKYPTHDIIIDYYLICIFYMTDLRDLKQLGLTSKQISIYKCILTCGKTTVLQLSKELNYPRSTVYECLNKLYGLELIADVYVFGRKYIIPENPVSLSNYVDKTRTIVDSILPELLNHYHPNQLSNNIRIYQGIKGMQKIDEMSLKYNKNYLTRVIGGVDNIFETYSRDYIKKYVSERVKRGIRNQVITTERIEHLRDMYSEKENKKYLREIRVLKNIDPLYVSLFHFGDYVCILPTIKEGYSVTIESQELVMTFNNLFDFLWNIALPIH